MAEDSHFTAGGGKELGIIRYGRERMDQHERQAEEDILPGDAVAKNQNANGVDTFVLHPGTREDPVYVAVEARGRGMDAQTETGYRAGTDLVIAVRPAGGGLNVQLDAGENATEGDSLVVDPNGTGKFHVYDSGTHDADDVVAEAAEDLDLSGASESELVGADWGGV